LDEAMAMADGKPADEQRTGSTISDGETQAATACANYRRDDDWRRGEHARAQ
jgi:hypothetical protein